MLPILIFTSSVLVLKDVLSNFGPFETTASGFKRAAGSDTINFPNLGSSTSLMTKVRWFTTKFVLLN